MKYFKNALITGCGGDVACSLARIARRANLFERLIGCDLREEHDGLEFFDKCHVGTRADDSSYFDRLSEIVDAEDIELIIPASDAELNAFFKAGNCHTFLGRAVVMASPRAVSVGLDKLDTAEFLLQQGLPHPWTKDSSKDVPIEYPCIFKPRQGQGSKGFEQVVTKEALATINRSNGVFQQFLPGDDTEFTCGLYRTSKEEVRHISFRRRLSGGLTGSGTVESIPEITTFLESLAYSLELVGSINVQLRLHDGVPMVFEINPRFSSTVRFRDRLGFQDFVWSVQERAGFEPAPWTPTRPGTRIIRGMDEIIYDPQR